MQPTAAWASGAVHLMARAQVHGDLGAATSLCQGLLQRMSSGLPAEPRRAKVQSCAAGS